MAAKLLGQRVDLGDGQLDRLPPNAGLIPFDDQSFEPGSRSRFCRSAAAVRRWSMAAALTSSSLRASATARVRSSSDVRESERASTRLRYSASSFSTAGRSSAQAVGHARSDPCSCTTLARCSSSRDRSSSSWVSCSDSRSRVWLACSRLGCRLAQVLLALPQASALGGGARGSRARFRRDPLGFGQGDRSVALGLVEGGPGGSGAAEADPPATGLRTGRLLGDDDPIGWLIATSTAWRQSPSTTTAEENSASSSDSTSGRTARTCCAEGVPIEGAGNVAGRGRPRARTAPARSCSSSEVGPRWRCSGCRSRRPGAPHRRPLRRPVPSRRRWRRDRAGRRGHRRPSQGRPRRPGSGRRRGPGGGRRPGPASCWPRRRLHACSSDLLARACSACCFASSASAAAVRKPGSSDRVARWFGGLGAVVRSTWCDDRRSSRRSLSRRVISVADRASAWSSASSWARISGALVGFGASSSPHSVSNVSCSLLSRSSVSASRSNSGARLLASARPPAARRPSWPIRLRGWRPGRRRPRPAARLRACGGARPRRCSDRGSVPAGCGPDW